MDCWATDSPIAVAAAWVTEACHTTIVDFFRTCLPGFTIIAYTACGETDNVGVLCRDRLLGAVSNIPSRSLPTVILR